MAENSRTSTVVSGHGLNKSTSRSVGEKFGSGFGILGLIVGILLAVSLIKSLMGSNSITFSGLLDTLASAPTVQMTMDSFDVIPALQWDGEILGAIAGFINIFITIFNVLIFAFKGLGQVVIYIVWFIKFLFV